MKIKESFFTDYTILENANEDYLSLSDTFKCGQCFRWEQLNDEKLFIGIAYEKILKAEQHDGFIKLNCNKEDYNNIWREYFDIDTDYDLIKEELQKDNIMYKAITCSPGIRILKQELFETTISFITSSNSNIKRISNNIRDLSIILGRKLEEEKYAFPTVKELSSSDLCTINKCRAGFRCNYILESSRMINKIVTDFNVNRYKSIGYEKTKKELMNFKGVGSKVADCIILFSGISSYAFPTDVWVKRIMENLYIKKEVSLDYVQKYGQEKFGPLAGYAQQYLFYYARSNNIK